MKLSLESLLDREFVGRHPAERVQIAEVPTFGTRIGRIMKTYDYINRVVITLPLSVYEVHGQHSPLSLLCHHHDLACT